MRSSVISSALLCLALVFVLPVFAAPENSLIVTEVGPFPLTQIRQKDLMSDEIFMKSLWGMRVEKCSSRADRIEIVTTGAVFLFNCSDSTLECRQRIATKRQTLTARFPSGLMSGLTVAAQDTGAVILKSPAGLTVKINCDSVLMLRTAKPALLDFTVCWQPAVVYEHGSSRLILDAYGAVALLPIRDAILQTIHTRQQNSYEIGADGELWVSVGPPRPYNWKESLNDRLIWQGSWQKPEYAVPSDDKIRKWAPYGNILWLQSEDMMWKSWHEGFEPRLPQEFARVLKTAHAQKQRVMAYFSPYYFTRGVGGTETATGDNVGEYFAAVKSFRDNYSTLDGFYFDGVYPASVEQTYRICRAMRAFLGPKKFFMIHCTGNAPGGNVYNPAADTYANAILRGEGQGFVGEEWLRYFISGYNISNAIGVVCNNAGHWIASPKEIEMTLRTNCRLAYMPFEPEEFPGGSVYSVNLPPTEVESRIRQNLQKLYWPRLNAEYPKWLEQLNATYDYSHGTASLAPLGPARFPLNGLKIEDLRRAERASLVYSAFGVDSSELAAIASINGVTLGELPYSGGDRWRRYMRIDLPRSAISSIGKSNAIVITNPNKDAFKVRDLYLLFNIDGKQVSSRIDYNAYTSASDWAYLEGKAVSLGEPISLKLDIQE